MANDKVPLEITEAAGEWLERLSSDVVSEDEREAFADWLLTSPVHVGEYLRISALREELAGTLARHPDWVQALLDGTDANVVELPQVVETPVSKASSRPHRRRRATVASIAAAAAVVALAITAWFGYASLVTVPADPTAIVTALGEQRSILLSDGSMLELNTETEVRIRLSDNARDIDLLRGEILVDVAKDPQRPFRVSSDGIIAQAIGTRFNVYRRGTDTVVTVIEGRVAVNQSPAVSSRDTQIAGTVAAIEPVELTAGLQVAVPPNAADVAPKPVSIAKATAWTERRLVFDDEPLSVIVVEFNRYNRSRLIITDAGLNDKRLSGVFDANDPDEFVALLASLERIDVQATADGHRTLVRVETTNDE